MHRAVLVGRHRWRDTWRHSTIIAGREAPRGSRARRKVASMNMFKNRVGASYRTATALLVITLAMLGRDRVLAQQVGNLTGERSQAPARRGTM